MVSPHVTAISRQFPAMQVSAEVMARPRIWRRDKFRDFFRDSERLFRGFGGDGENLSVEEAVNHAARRSGAHCNRAERIANALPENFPQLGDTFQVLFQVEERGKGERSSP